MKAEQKIKKEKTMKTQSVLIKAALIVMFACSMASVAFGGIYRGGNGDPNEPYQIATAQDLIDLGVTPEDYDKHFILTADIDLDPNLPGGRVFDRAVIAPDTDDIESGFQGTSFTGTFDGSGLSIRNLLISNGVSYLGLFGSLDQNAMIMDLSLENITIEGSGNLAGALAGYTFGDVSNCYCTGLVKGNGGVGGLVGYNYGSVLHSFNASKVSGIGSVGGLAASNYGSILDCFNRGAVSAEGDYIGGLVGWNHGSILDSFNTGETNGQERVGGLVGKNAGGSVAHCHSDCTVNGHSFVGGIVGRNVSDGNISNCYSIGIVSGTRDWIGGIVGSILSGVVSDCHSSSAVTGSGLVGGLSGRNSGIVSNCQSSGIVNGSEKVGGLVGYNGYYDYDGGGSVTNSYSSATVSGRRDWIGGLVGLTSAASSISNCYSTGPVDATKAMGAGGLVGGSNAGSSITNCFWDIETSGHADGAGGTGLTTVEMQSIKTFLNAGWDLVGEPNNGTEDVWYTPANDYPRIAPNVMLSGLSALTATGDDGEILAIEDANATCLSSGVTLFERNAEWPNFPPESVDDLDLSTIAICDNQSYTVTQFEGLTKKAVILIRGVVQPARIQLLDQQGLPMSRAAWLDVNDFVETGYDSLGKPVLGTVIALNDYFYGIEISAPVDETLNLALVSIVAVLEHIEATEVQFGEIAALEVRTQDNTITAIDGNSVSDLILGTTSFDAPAVWDILFPEEDADDFLLDTLANTENQVAVQTVFSEPVTKVLLIVRPAFESIDSGQIELLDEQGQALGEPIAFTQADFTSLGHESLGKKVQGLVVTGNGYFHGIRIQQDDDLEVSIDLVSISAVPLD